ncbi:MAG TPA: MarR family transcriptional regulator [Candidatus Binatia bacterium]|nr:MarR family transcriptional regulator [Candidatus Binatia bacterium]
MSAPSSRNRRKTASLKLRTALLTAGREYSASAVMFHGAVAARFGLSATDLKTLDILQRQGTRTAGELAAHTGLATPSVTALIDRLEAKGLLRRVRGREDRRRVLVELTPALEKEVAPLFGPLSRRMLARFERYSAREIELIRDFLLRGADEMREETATLVRSSPPRTGPRAPAARARA